MELTRTELEALSDTERQSVLEKINSDLTLRVLGSTDFDSEVKAIIGELKSLGHDLYLYDSDGEWQIWSGDWSAKSKTSDKLILHFDPVQGVEASWSLT